MKLKGYICGVLAAASYGMNPLFALPLYDEGLDANSVLLLRYAGALPILALMILLRGRSLRLTRLQTGATAVLGLLLGLSSYGLFASYTYMDAGVASTLLFVYPLMVALIMAGVYRERLTGQTWVCLAAALAGIWLLSRTAEGVTVSGIGVMWVMVSALSYAIYIVAVNRIKGMQTVATLVLTFYVLLFGLVIFVAKAAADGAVGLPTSAQGWGCVAGLALVPTALSLSLTTVAIHYIGSTPTAILGVFEPVTAVAVGVTVFGEVLTGRQTAGLVLVLAAVTIVVAGGNLHGPMMRLKKMFPSLRKGKK